MINFLNSRKKIIIISIIFLWIFVVAFKNVYKDMPEGTDFVSKTFISKSENIKFLYDLSYKNEGEQVHEQEIFDEILKHIDSSKKYILIDMFLFNSQLGKSNSSYRQLSMELGDALIEKKNNYPDIKIDLITDPINTVYGGYKSELLKDLEEAGINLIITNLEPLRDSNPLWSSIYRLSFRHLGNSENHGWLKNPFSEDGSKVSLRSYLKLLNFKANHRKVFVADYFGDMVTVISSANPHDASSAHSNVAIKIYGDFWQSVWLSEQAVAQLSGDQLSSPPLQIGSENLNNGDANISLELITESQIERSLVEAIDNSEQDDQIHMMMFYLSNRKIIESLLRAANRGVDIQIVLDPNKDAFGYKKNGIPNRQVAHELKKKSDDKINIRWYDTSGEQFHSKLSIVTHKNGPARVILGSANLTRRNIGNYNLESNVNVVAQGSTVFIQDIHKLFKRIWENQNGIYSANYDTYKDDSKIKFFLYRLQEASGLSSF